MDPKHPATLTVDQLLVDCDVDTGRRGGPGGQHRNKVETAVMITHRPTGLRAEASERRSQGQNRAEALRRLRLKLALELRVVRSKTDGPTALLADRCRDGQLKVAKDNEDYPALFAEVLDWLEAVELQPADAAQIIGCTTSQLIKFLKNQPPAWQRINQRRIDAGRSKLH